MPQHASNQDRPNYEDKSDFELLALHLACAPEFHKRVRRTPDTLKAASLRKDWLQSINLQGRDQAIWRDHFEDPLQQIQIIERAIELVKEVPAAYVARICDIPAAPPPSYTPE